MNILTDILGNTIGTVIDSAGRAIDDLVTSDEEKRLIDLEFRRIKAEVELEVLRKSQEYEKTISKRWLSDNENILTRLVRPGALVFMLVVFTAMIFTDGIIAGYTLNPAYTSIIETLLTTMIIGYFGSRGIEKTASIFKAKEVQDQDRIDRMVGISLNNQYV